VVTKSPLTGFIADSLSSSFFALELKRTGLDALVITGRASSAVYLFIADERVEVREGEHLWGRSASESEALIRSEVEDTGVRVAAIGRAGENCVRFATISNEGRHAGRGGVGAVMGSKNLKAIALRGQGGVNVADPQGVESIAESMRHRSLDTVTAKYREIGTVFSVTDLVRLRTVGRVQRPFTQELGGNI
jgi:aldehyde:ferredoxin oxidoreductase